MRGRQGASALVLVAPWADAVPLGLVTLGWQATHAEQLHKSQGPRLWVMGPKPAECRMVF